MLAFVRKHMNHLFHIQDTPHSIAMGTALGIFFGFIPLFGLKILLALFFAAITKSNKMAAVITVNLHDLTLPLLPFFLGVEYVIGCRVLGLVKHQKSLDLLNQTGFIPHWTEVLNKGMPILIGSFFVAVPMGILSYWIMKKILMNRNSDSAE